VFSKRRIPFALLALVFAGCSKQAPGPAPRYAVIRFENLTGDASLDWVARAASEVLSRSLSGAMDGPVLSAPTLNRAGSGVSSERERAELAGANRVVSGYLARVGGKLRFSATEEDLNKNQTLQSLSSEGAEPLAAMLNLARAFSGSARPYLTSNPEVLKLYVSALEEPADRAIPDLRQATGADPGFGPAWVALVDAEVLRGDREASIEAAREALGRKLDPADKAAIELQQAALTNDVPGRIAALRELVSANPGDRGLLQTLAVDEGAAGQFAQAAADWKKLRDAVPTDRNAWNQFGYTLAWSGDFSAALQAMKDYGARWPTDPNPIDSTGDLYYMYGRFADAAANYLKAHEKSPEFLNGGDLYKAAWAQFRAGDKVKAESSFEQYRKTQKKVDAPSLTLLGIDWLYRTGREKEAMALLRKVAETSTQAGAASQYWSQLVIYDLLAKDRLAAAKDAAIDATKPGSNLSTVARFAALPSASASEWQNRADTVLRGAGVESVRRFTLGVALLLDGKKEAAQAVWDKIVAESSASDFFARAVDAKIRGEKPRFELVPDPTAVNELRALPDKI
jgi:tetratricopeptide (TPR) repeat protein